MQVLRNFGSAYKSNINAFVAPSDGLYFLSSTVMSEGDTKDLELHFFKNNADYNIGCYEAGNDHTSCTMFAPMTLKKNDRVDIRCAVTTGGSVWASKSSNSGRGLTNFRGFKLFDKNDKKAVAFQAVLPYEGRFEPGMRIMYTQEVLNVGVIRSKKSKKVVGGYDAARARFIAPKSGVYSFGVNQLSYGGTRAVELAFFKNGFDYKVRSSVLSQYSINSFTATSCPCRSGVTMARTRTRVA